MDRLTTAQKIGVGGALLLLIASFLPWYSVSGGGFTFSINAWDSGFLAIAGVILGVVAGVILLMKAMGQRSEPLGGLAPEQLALILAVASLVLIILRLITQSTASAYGMYLGIVAAALTAWGSFQAMTASGMTVDDMKQRFRGDSTSGPGTPPPPAP